MEGFSPIPYLATLLNCMMWVLYGIPLVHPHSLLVVTINGTGLLLQTIYLTIFILYSTPPARVTFSLGYSFSSFIIFFFLLHRRHSIPEFSLPIRDAAIVSARF